MMLDTRIHRVISIFQSPPPGYSSFSKGAALSACGSWVYLASGSNVITWRTEYSKDYIKSWESLGDIVGIAAHPYDHIMAFCRLRDKQCLDFYTHD